MDSIPWTSSDNGLPVDTRIEATYKLQAGITLFKMYSKNCEDGILYRVSELFVQAGAKMIWTSGIMKDQNMSNRAGFSQFSPFTRWLPR